MATTRERPLAVVTGASSGIGFELAKQFADQRLRPVVAAEDEEIADAAAELAASAAPPSRRFRSTCATDAGVEELYPAIAATAARSTRCALNAGIGARRRVRRPTPRSRTS